MEYNRDNSTANRDLAVQILSDLNGLYPHVKGRQEALGIIRDYRSNLNMLGFDIKQQNNRFVMFDSTSAESHSNTTQKDEYKDEYKDEKPISNTQDSNTTTTNINPPISSSTNQTINFDEPFWHNPPPSDVENLDDEYNGDASNEGDPLIIGGGGGGGSVDLGGVDDAIDSVQKEISKKEIAKNLAMIGGVTFASGALAYFIVGTLAPENNTAKHIAVIGAMLAGAFIVSKIIKKE